MKEETWDEKGPVDKRKQLLAEVYAKDKMNKLYDVLREHPEAVSTEAMGTRIRLNMQRGYYGPVATKKAKMLKLQPNAEDLIEEAGYDYEAEARRNEPAAKEQTGDLTGQHIKAQALEEGVDHDIRNDRVEKELKDNPHAQALLGKDDPENYYHELDKMEAFVEHADAQARAPKVTHRLPGLTVNTMPEFLYRGAYRPHFKQRNRLGIIEDREFDPEVDGFRGVGASIEDLWDKENGKVFVSTEPTVAASYGLSGHYDNRMSDEVTPDMLADYVYEILTEGLDADKLTVDPSASTLERLYGPQFQYEGDIPQEMVTIRDYAGNTRTVPRIKKIKLHEGRPGLSDARVKTTVSDYNCKDVYMNGKKQKPALTRGMY